MVFNDGIEAFYYKNYLDIAGPFVIQDDIPPDFPRPPMPFPPPTFPQMEAPGQDTFSSYLASGDYCLFNMHSLFL